MVVVLNRRIIIFVQQMLIHKLFYRILCQIRIDCAGSVAKQRREMMYLMGFAGL